MPDDPTQAAADPAEGGSAASTASAPATATDDGFSIDAAFDAAFGASNSDRPSDPTPEGKAESETPAATVEAAASKPGEDAKPADGKPAQREPQPGSRRSTADELAATREQVKTLMAEIEAERAAQQKADADKADAEAQRAADVERLIGKPGEMAALLQKRAESMRPGSTVHFSYEDEDRLTELTNGTLLYAPLQARARADVQAELDAKVAESEGLLQAVVSALSAQIRGAAGLPGIDPSVLDNEADLGKVIRHAHAAGASSRDAEVADLQAQLLEARGRAFASQPPLPNGGVSAGGRPGLSYDPNKSPQSNLEEIFGATANGRR